MTLDSVCGDGDVTRKMERNFCSSYHTEKLAFKSTGTFVWVSLKRSAFPFFYASSLKLVARVVLTLALEKPLFLPRHSHKYLHFRVNRPPVKPFQRRYVAVISSVMHLDIVRIDHQIVRGIKTAPRLIR